MMNEINSCEVCGGKTLSPVLELGNHPMCDDLISIGSEILSKEYPISILFCNECKTAHQKYQVPKVELFPSSYHYRSRFTADVLNGMKGLVADCEKEYGPLRGKLVLDIGCNDGSLLNFFAENGARTIGIEPTDACLDAMKNGHAVYKDYFSVGVAEEIRLKYGAPDIITFTNVFAHIENLGSVLDALKVLAGKNTALVIENHYLGSVLSGFQFDTFYHEHPRTYSYSSFKYIAKSLDMYVNSVVFPSRYGGNIRVSMSVDAKLAQERAFSENELLQAEAQFQSKFAFMRNYINIWKQEKLTEMEGLVQKWGALPAKAFPGRAAILVKLLGLTEEHVSAVYEKVGSLKIGYYVPGTRIPIKSEAELVLSGVPILNFAWHISSEICEYMRNLGYEGEVVDILRPPVPVK